MGRWYSRDAKSPADGLNIYQYVHSDPLSNNDPMGLAAQDAQGSGSGSGSTDSVLAHMWPNELKWFRLLNGVQQGCVVTATGLADLIPNRLNDFKHCNWACMLCKCVNRQWAYGFLKAHEDDHNYGPENRKRDERANKKGLKCCTGLAALLPCRTCCAPELLPWDIDGSIPSQDPIE